MVGGRRFVDQIDQLVFGAIPSGLLLTRKLNPVPSGEMLDRFGERHPLGQHQKLEDVAPFATPEAVEETLATVDVERRRLLAMERAEPLVTPAGDFQRRHLGHDLDEIGCVADAGDD